MWCAEGRLLASRERLRRFLLLKLAAVLLLPHSAGLPLLVACVFSLRVLSLLRSPHVSTKPSTVLLGHLAFADILVLLRWMLQLGWTLAEWTETAGYEFMGPINESAWWGDAVSILCQQLLDAHHLVSLLLLGLLGLESTLVSHWPQQTRRFRTSRWAQLSCRLVWVSVLLELAVSLNSKLLQECRPQDYSSTLQKSQSFPPGLVPSLSSPAFSPLLRRTLWLVNLWLHYTVLNSKPQKKRGSFH